MWPDSFKDRMLNANEEDTVLMFRRLKNTTRVFANKVAKEVESIENNKGADFKFQDVAHLVAGTRGRAAEKAGDADGGKADNAAMCAVENRSKGRGKRLTSCIVDHHFLITGIWTAGQVVGLINDIPTVADLMQRIMQECEETIQGRLNDMLVGAAGGGMTRSRL